METVTILLVEDEVLLLLAFEQALVEAGFAVLAVASGKKALKIMSDAATTIQGIITDIRFHKTPDGWDVARFSREVDPEMPVVYVSGDSDPDWASKGVPNSIILGKPFTMAQLVTAISKLLNDRRLRTTVPSAS
ncbi:response regulator [Sinorhizobium meliloti]|uniref:response regulator n=1 Tax=Rhizobium meliloti TaxID=382 RepID=UPI003F181469